MHLIAPLVPPMPCDQVGNLLSITDLDQNRTSYTYDSLDRQLTDTNQLGLSRTYSYNYPPVLKLCSMWI
jgi:YD repeat-containing protein